MAEDDVPPAVKVEVEESEAAAASSSSSASPAKVASMKVEAKEATDTAAAEDPKGPDSINGDGAKATKTEEAQPLPKIKPEVSDDDDDDDDDAGPSAAAAAAGAGAKGSGQDETIVVPYKDGQRRPTPPAGAGTRVFYESLYKQNPDSQIALAWCLLHGVVPTEKVEGAMRRLERLKQEQKQIIADRPKPKKDKKDKKDKKRKLIDMDGGPADELLGGSAGAGDEGVGTTTM